MYEKFTDRTRKLMQIANQEACRLNHEYVGTEHVLLAMLKNKNVGHTLHAIASPGAIDGMQSTLQRLVRPGPDMITMGKLPCTPRLKKVIGYAVEASAGMRNNFVGVEHILIGLTLETEGVSGQVLREAGVTQQMVMELACETTEQPVAGQSSEVDGFIENSSCAAAESLGIHSTSPIALRHFFMASPRPGAPARESLMIIFGRQCDELPTAWSIEQVAEFYDAQAGQLVSDIINHLPQGVVERVAAKLLEKTASNLVYALGAK
jgi:hypothetical protein